MCDNINVMSLDISVLYFFNGLAGQWPVFDLFVVFFASYFQYILVAVFIVLLLTSKYSNWKRFNILFVSALAAVIARLVLAELIRLFFYRARPFLAYHNIYALLTDYESSFPSGHTIFFFAFSMVIYKYNRKWGWFFFIASLPICIARVIAGVHYPSDIIGGMILGLLVGYLVYKIAERQKEATLQLEPNNFEHN
jgi:undecaprenyl-diphosphatase